MPRKRTSPIWTTSREKMQSLMDSCESFVGVLKKLGLDAYSGNHRTLKERIKEDGLSVKRLSENRNNFMSRLSINKKIPICDLMIENSKCAPNHLKKRIIKEGVLPYICSNCGNDGNWLGKRLVLQLEHKNGNSSDNRLCNLCLLCPNCHSQTETYAGRNSSMKKSRVCCDCGGATKGKGKKCFSCAAKNQPKKFVVDRVKLQDLINKHPMTKVGKMFGVSDNAIRKRCSNLGVEVPKNGRGFWTSLKSKKSG